MRLVKWKEIGVSVSVQHHAYREERGEITIQNHVSSCSDLVQSGSFEWTAGEDASAIGISPIFLILFLAPNAHCLHRCYGIHHPHPQCAAITADKWPGRRTHIFFTTSAPHNGGDESQRWSARNGRGNKSLISTLEKPTETNQNSRTELWVYIYSRGGSNDSRSTRDRHSEKGEPATWRMKWV